MATEAQIVAFLRSPGVPLVSGRDWKSSCQALMYQLCKKFGSAPVVYASAHAAYAASRIISKNPALAQPGDFHFFDLNAADHVSLSFGGSRGLMGSNHCPDDAALNAGFMTVEAYCKASGATYLGFSRTDGANDIPIEVTPVALPANWRTVGGTNANRRSTAHVPAEGEPSNISAPPLEAGLSYEITGWCYDTDPKVFINGSNIWFDVNGAKSHASAFTSQSTAYLKDLNPVVPPVVTPPATTTGATKAEVQAIVSASEAKVLAAIAAAPKPPTAAEIGAEVIRQQKLPGN